MTILESISRIFGGKAAPVEPPPPPQLLPISIDSDKSEEENIRNLQAALNSGTDINGKLNANQSPLCEASRYGMQNVAQFLIDHGAELNPTGRETPFMYAAQYFQLDMMKFLVSKGADPLQPDGIPQDAMVKYMLAYIWDRDKDPDFPQKDRDCMQYLLDQGLQLPEWGRSKIYTERKALEKFVPGIDEIRKFEQAAKDGDVATVRKIVADGMHPDEPARCGGRSPMDYAIASDDVDQVHFLLDHGASANQWSGYMTPIMRAAREGARKCFTELLCADADTSQLYTSDRYPDTTVVELAQECKKDTGMKAFVEDAIAHRAELAPFVPPTPDVETERKISVHAPLKLKLATP